MGGLPGQSEEDRAGEWEGRQGPGTEQESEGGGSEGGRDGKEALEEEPPATQHNLHLF